SAAAHATLPPGDAGAPRGLTAVNLLLLGGFLLAFWLIGMLLPGSWLLRAMLVGTLLAALLVWEWHRVLNADDRKTILALYARLAGKSAA
ncbi:MAG: hypothetical protein Q8L65_07115, partial [Burkholderiales bacterium]|nr:hypothetical protein [Burkholderiales bacterium]